MKNNTTTRNLTSIVAVLMAATLVVGTFATMAITQSAYAYAKKPLQDDNKKTRDNGSGNGNGNTVTIEECKNKGSASGFDTALDQECENLICTHPGENATCVQEGLAATTTTTTPVKLTCEECFRKFLSADQLSRLLELLGVNSLPDLCAQLSSGSNPELAAFVHEFLLRSPGLIQCLIDAGIVFPPVRG